MSFLKNVPKNRNLMGKGFAFKGFKDEVDSFPKFMIYSNFVWLNIACSSR
jgi:hypothetical protein